MPKLGKVDSKQKGKSVTGFLPMCKKYAQMLRKVWNLPRLEESLTALLMKCAESLPLCELSGMPKKMLLK